LRHGAVVDAKDKVMNWTAMHYAVKTENWLVVERVLSHMFSQMKDKDHYNRRNENKVQEKSKYTNLSSSYAKNVKLASLVGSVMKIWGRVKCAFAFYVGRFLK
jgi:hypothetical protein